MSSGDLSRGCGLNLTSERLSLIPKRNTQQFLQDYIRNQRRLSGSYIIEADHSVFGCGLVGDPSADDQQYTEKIGDFAFGTPILKPRVPVLPVFPSAKASELPTNKFLDDNSQLPESNMKSAEVTSRKKRSHSAIQEENNHRGVEIGRKKSGKGHVHVGSGVKGDETKTNDDHTKRLEERRQRRKSKKEIMNPPPNEDLSEENQATTKKERSRKKQTKNTQIGFALMHGFTATNVGKNRLTLDAISRDIGVFQKGKASKKASVSNKHKKEQGKNKSYFSEANFLNSKPSRKKEYSISSSSSTLSDDEAAPSCEKYINSEQNSATKNKGKQKAHVQESPASVVRSRPAYDPAESIVWDIEKDSNMMVVESDSNNNPRSILVTCPSHFVKGSPKAKSPCDSMHAFDASMGPVTTCKGLMTASSPSARLSLAPSQSASQVAQKAHRGQVKHNPKGNPDISGEVSKYFEPPGTTSVPDRFAHASPSVQKAMLDHHSFDHRSSVPLEIPACSDSLKDSHYLDIKLGEENHTSDYSPPGQDALLLSQVSGSPRSPLGIAYDTNLGSGLSEYYALSAGPCGPQNETFSMYCSPPLPLWPLSNTDDHSSEIEYNVLPCESLLGQHKSRENVFDVDWEDTISDTGCHPADVDGDHFPDTYLSGRMTGQSDLLLAPWDSPGNPQDDLVQDIHWQDTVSCHDDIPYSDYSHGDQILEINLSSAEHHDKYKSSLMGSCLENDGSALGDNFCQGRDLLNFYNSGLPTKSSNAEAEVAGLLKASHWKPHRF